MAGKDELAALFIRLGINDKEFRAGLKHIGKDIQATEGHTGKLGKGLKQLRNIALAAFAGWGIKEVSRAVINTSLEVDRFHKRMNASAGSVDASKEAMTYFRGEVNRLGLSLIDSQKGFTNLTAAARLSGVGFNEVKQIFTGISEASVAMQLSSDDAYGAMRAIVQIMSKGKVQAEELRGQLGERLPGAFGIAAAAMGKTTAELSKMLDRGQVLSAEFLPKFGKKISEIFAGDAAKNAESFNQQINRLKNTWFEFIESLNDQGLIIALGGATKLLSDTIKYLSSFVLQDTGYIKTLKTIEEVQAAQKEVAIDIHVINGAWVKTLDTEYRLWKKEQERLQLAERLLEIKKDEQYNRKEGARWENEQLKYKMMVDALSVKIAKEAQEELNAETEAKEEQRKLDEKMLAIKAKVLEMNRLESQDIIDRGEYLKDINRVQLLSASLSKEIGGYQGEIKEQVKDLNKESEEYWENMAWGAGLWEEALQDWEESQVTISTPFQDFFKQLKVDLKKSSEEWNDWGKHLNTITKDFGSNLHGSLSDTFFSLVKGDLDNLGDIWRGFADGLLKSVTNVIADMAISWGAKALVSLMPKFEEGAWEVRGEAGGTPSMLHPGEMVVPAKQADQLREKWKNLESMNVGISSISDTFGGDRIDNSTISSFMSGAAKGSLAQMAMLGAAGLFGPGAGMWGAILDAAPGGLLAGGISGGFSALLEDAGFLGGKGNIGQTAGGILGGIALGPAGSLMGGVIGQIAGELIGDLTGLRHNDALRDSIEEMGYGRATSAIVSGWTDLFAKDEAIIGENGIKGIVDSILGSATPVDSIGDIMGTFISGLVEGIANPTSTYGQDWMTPGSGIDMPGTGVDISPGLDFGGNTGWNGGWGWGGGWDGGWDGGWGGQGDDGGWGGEGWGGGDDGGGGWGGEGDDAGWRHGTGMEGLPETGSFTGHEGEIVMSPEESNLLRRGQGGGGGGNITVNVQIDGKTIATAIAKQAYRNNELSQAIKSIAKR